MQPIPQKKLLSPDVTAEYENILSSTNWLVAQFPQEPLFTQHHKYMFHLVCHTLCEVDNLDDDNRTSFYKNYYKSTNGQNMNGILSQQESKSLFGNFTLATSYYHLPTFLNDMCCTLLVATGISETFFPHLVQALTEITMAYLQAHNLHARFVALTYSLQSVETPLPIQQISLQTTAFSNADPNLPMNTLYDYFKQNVERLTANQFLFPQQGLSSVCLFYMFARAFSAAKQQYPYDFLQPLVSHYAADLASRPENAADKAFISVCVGQFNNDFRQLKTPTTYEELPSYYITCYDMLSTQIKLPDYTKFLVPYIEDLLADPLLPPHFIPEAFLLPEADAAFLYGHITEQVNATAEHLGLFTATQRIVLFSGFTYLICKTRKIAKPTILQIYHLFWSSFSSTEATELLPFYKTFFNTCLSQYQSIYLYTSPVSYEGGIAMLAQSMNSYFLLLPFLQQELLQHLTLANDLSSFPPISLLKGSFHTSHKKDMQARYHISDIEDQAVLKLFYILLSYAQPAAKDPVFFSEIIPDWGLARFFGFFTAAALAAFPYSKKVSYLLHYYFIMHCMHQGINSVRVEEYADTMKTTALRAPVFDPSTSDWNIYIYNLSSYGLRTIGFQDAQAQDPTLINRMYAYITPLYNALAKEELSAILAPDEPKKDLQFLMSMDANAVVKSAFTPPAQNASNHSLLTYAPFLVMGILPAMVVSAAIQGALDSASGRNAPITSEYKYAFPKLSF